VRYLHGLRASPFNLVHFSP